MVQTFTDLSEPRFQPQSNDPKDFPHGLVKPPEHIVAQVAAERAKYPPKLFDDSYAKITIDDWTLRYYYQGFNVKYRSVPDGVEVVAVGDQEIGDWVRRSTPAERGAFIGKSV